MFGERPAAPHNQADMETARQSQYWKRFGDNFVTIGPTEMTDGPEYRRFIRHKKYKPLSQSFGVEVVGDKVYAPTVRAGDKPQQITGTMLSKHGHMQLRNFIANGGLTARDERGDYGPVGAYLMPREQLIALNMYRQPEVRAARPDVADMVDVPCPFSCLAFDGKGGVRQFSCEEHKNQHVVAAHPEAIASEAVGRSIAQSMKLFQGSGGIDATTIAAIVAATVAALNGTEKQAIAALQSMAVPVEVALPELHEDLGGYLDDDEEEVQGQVQPEPEPVTVVVKTNFAGKRPDDTSSRNEMWAWMKENAVAFPPDKGHLRMSRTDTLYYIKSSFPQLFT